MATTDDSIRSLEELRVELEQRIAELQPALREFEQLQEVLGLLRAGVLSGSGMLPTSLHVGSVVPGGFLPIVPRARRGRVRGRDGRAPQGANKRLIVELVLAAPGITVAELAERSALKQTVVRATVNRLKRTGEFEAMGEGVRVPLGRSPRVSGADLSAVH